MTRIIDEVKLDYTDVLILPKRTKTASRKDVNINREFRFYHSDRQWNGMPVMAANMDTTGTFAMSDVFCMSNMITCLHKHYSAKNIIDYFRENNNGKPSLPSCERKHKYTWISIGIKDSDIQKIKSIRHSLCYYPPNICIDVANGYTDDFVNFCSKIRELMPNSIIMAGNVCTPEMVSELILQGGVDIVKIGIGPGSVCSTRMVTGVGYPQLSAVLECSDAAHGLKREDKRLGLICADGGIKEVGHISKSFGAGADFVMLGGLLAGYDECDGNWEYEEKIKKSLQFYGMSSFEAQSKYGDIKKYRASEGLVTSVPYKGKVSNLVQEIEGGIRSCCAYIGATSIKDMPRCTTFVKVNRTK